MLYQVGATKDEMGGSQFALVESLTGGQPPRVNLPLARSTFAELHQAIRLGLVRACHDLSEGGLAAAIAEMALAGGLGARVFLDQAPQHFFEPAAEAGGEEQSPAPPIPYRNAVLLFTESNSRFLCEVPSDSVEQFEEIMGDVPFAAIGEVLAEPKLQIVSCRRGQSGERRDRRAAEYIEGDVAISFAMVVIEISKNAPPAACGFACQLLRNRKRSADARIVARSKSS